MPYDTDSRPGRRAFLARGLDRLESAEEYAERREYIRAVGKRLGIGLA